MDNLSDSRPLVSVIIPTYNRRNKLVALLESLRNSDYPNLEVVIVDDHSTDGTPSMVENLFPEAKLVTNSEEMFLSACRNIGSKIAKGQYLLHVDDDNILDRRCISELVSGIEKDPSIAVVGPITYYLKSPRRIWYAGILRNMTTSQTKWLYRDRFELGNSPKIIESEQCTNVFLVKREILEKVGLFDEDLFPIHYEDSDFSERIRREGYKIICDTDAKAWHDVSLPEDVGKARLYHVHSPFRAYFVARNRIIFLSRYAKPSRFIMFMLVFNWLFAAYYVALILRAPIAGRNKVMLSYIRGTMDGMKAMYR